MKNNKHFGSFHLKVIAVFSAALIILFCRLCAGSLMSGNPYLFDEKEILYRYYSSLHISQFITSHFAASLIFNIALFALPVLFLFTVQRIFVIVFSLLVIIYFLTYNMATGHYYHSLVGLIVITIPFWFKKEGRFNTMWEIARYYWLYIFASAALWKIFRGTVFYKEQLSNILKAQQLDLLVQSPASLQAHVTEYLIAHPDVSHIALIVNVILQLCFLVGFFTKKYDVILFWLAIIFCVANYYVMSIVSAELLILNLTLLNWEKIESG